MDELSTTLSRLNTSLEGVWAYFLPDNPLPRQGMKIHISAHLDNFMEVFGRVTPFLLENSIPFKCINSKDNLHSLNIGLFGLSQIGKFITIYPDEKIKEILRELEVICSGLNGPIITSDERVKLTNIYLRYGVIEPKDGKIGKLLTPTGKYIDDKRDGKKPFPYWVQGYDFLKSRTNLLENLVITKPFRLRGRGGVFSGVLRSESGIIEKVIVKEARPYGEYHSSTDNSLTRIRNEKEILKTIQKTKVGPKLLEYREKNKHGILIMEKISGQTLKCLLEEFNEFPLDFKKQFKENFKLLLDQIHKLNVFHGDVSPDNIIVNDKVRLIDFEHACVWSGKNIFQNYGSIGFFPKEQEGRALKRNELKERDQFGFQKCLEALDNPIKYREIVNV